MLIVLFVVTLVASAAVGYVQTLTAGPIQKAKEEKQQNAIKEVIPGEFDNNPVEEVRKIEKDGGILEVYPAKKNGAVIGIAVKSFTNNGFGGNIAIMVGFYPDGKLFNYSVLEAKETPGLGSKLDFWFKAGQKGSIQGYYPKEQPLTVSKDGGKIDAITAATISSRAFLEAVNLAASVLNSDIQSAKDNELKQDTILKE